MMKKTVIISCIIYTILVSSVCLLIMSFELPLLHKLIFMVSSVIFLSVMFSLVMMFRFTRLFRSLVSRFEAKESGETTDISAEDDSRETLETAHIRLLHEKLTELDGLVDSLVEEKREAVNGQNPEKSQEE